MDDKDKPVIDAVSNEDLLDSIIESSSDKLRPWEDCYLPSGGFYYGWPNGKVKVRPWGLVDEKIIANQRLAANGTMMSTLLAECCQFPDGFDQSSLLVGDQTFLLYYLRGITHGNLYEFMVTCPHCKAASTHEYDMHGLIGTVKQANQALGNEPIKVVLPDMSEVLKHEVAVGIRFLRVNDLTDIVRRRKVMGRTIVGKARSHSEASAQSVDDNSETIADMIEAAVHSVLGQTNRHKIKAFMTKLGSADGAVLSQFIQDNTPGIDSLIDVTCPTCKEGTTLQLPLTETFFRPKVFRGRGSRVEAPHGAGVPAQEDELQLG